MKTFFKTASGYIYNLDHVERIVPKEQGSYLIEATFGFHHIHGEEAKELLKAVETYKSSKVTTEVVEDLEDVDLL